MDVWFDSGTSWAGAYLLDLTNVFTFLFVLSSGQNFKNRGDLYDLSRCSTRPRQCKDAMYIPLNVSMKSFSTDDILELRLKEVLIIILALT